MSTSTTAGRVVVRHRRFVSVVEPSTPALGALVRRLVPAIGREADSSGPDSAARRDRPPTHQPHGSEGTHDSTP